MSLKIIQKSRYRNIGFISIIGFMFLCNYQAIFFLFQFYFDPIHGEEYLLIDKLGLLPAIIGILLSAIYFIKGGLLINEQKVSKIYDLFGKIIYSEKIKTDHLTSITILQFYFKEEDEDSEYSSPINSRFTNKEINIYGLNQSHSKRVLFFSSKEEELSKINLQKISEEMNLPIVKYNPPAARRRKSQRRR